MVYTLLPNGRQQFFDANGNPLVGGFVYMYEPGTTVFQNTCQNAAGSILNTNPIVLDSLGSALIYGSGQYRQIVTDSLGNQIWDALTQDLYSLITANGGTTFDTIQTGTLVVEAVAQVPNVITGDSSLSAANTRFVQTAINSIPSVTFQNKIRNGNFNVYQRGVSGTITAGTPSYAADGFIISCTGANVTWAQNSSGYLGSSNAIAIDSAVGVTDAYIKQRIEGSIAAALIYSNTSDNATFQAAIYNNTGSTFTPTLSINTANAVDNWSSSSPVISNISLQPCPPTTWTVVSYTLSVGTSVDNGVEAIVDFGATLNGTGKVIVTTNWDFRASPSATVGLNSTPPLPELRPIPFELLYCQRYYYQIVAATNQALGYGYATGSNAFEFSVPIPIRMRVQPTVTPPAVAADVQINGSLTASTLINSTINQSTLSLLTFSGTTASGITSGQGLAARWAGSNGFIAASAEL